MDPILIAHAGSANADHPIVAGQLLDPGPAEVIHAREPIATVLTVTRKG
jgi:hypothetical protein